MEKEAYDKTQKEPSRWKNQRKQSKFFHYSQLRHVTATQERPMMGRVSSGAFRPTGGLRPEIKINSGTAYSSNIKWVSTRAPTMKTRDAARSRGPTTSQEEKGLRRYIVKLQKVEHGMDTYVSPDVCWILG